MHQLTRPGIGVGVPALKMPFCLSSADWLMMETRQRRLSFFTQSVIIWSRAGGGMLLGSGTQPLPETITEKTTHELLFRNLDSCKIFFSSKPTVLNLIKFGL